MRCTWGKWEDAEVRENAERRPEENEREVLQRGEIPVYGVQIWEKRKEEERKPAKQDLFFFWEMRKRVSVLSKEPRGGRAQRGREVWEVLRKEEKENYVLSNEECKERALSQSCEEPERLLFYYLVCLLSGKCGLSKWRREREERERHLMSFI